jgi:preprotein translocase subunit SecG
MGILIGVFTFILVLISVFLILVVLAQKAKSDGGMGAALGGGAAEAAFGAETGNVLTTSTIRAAIAFFILSFGLYLGHLYQHKHVGTGGKALPTIAVPATAPAPATDPMSLGVGPGAPAPTTPVVPAAPVPAPAPAVPAPAPVEQPK